MAVDGAGAVYVAVNDYGGVPSVYKLTTGGALDPTFGVQTISGGGAQTFIGGIRLNAAGTRVLVGAASGQNIQVHALRADTGTLDTTFGGGDGIAAIAAASFVEVNDIVVRPADGKIYVGGGEGRDLGGLSQQATPMVARFTSDGAADTFGSGGISRPFLGTSDQAGSVNDLFTVGDKTYAVGSGHENPSTYSRETLAIARLTDTGGLDAAFDGDGRLTDFLAGSHGRWNGLNVQQDGGVVVTGGRFVPGSPGNHHRAITRRYTEAGSLDTSFADAGSLDLDNTYPAVALVAQASVPGGRYVSMAYIDDPVDPSKSLLQLTGIKATLAQQPQPSLNPSSHSHSRRPSSSRSLNPNSSSLHPSPYLRAAPARSPSVRWRSPPSASSVTA